MMGCTRLTTDYCTNTTRGRRDHGTKAPRRGSWDCVHRSRPVGPMPCRHLSVAQKPVQNAQFLGSRLFINETAPLPHYVSDRHTEVAQETWRIGTAQVSKLLNLLGNMLRSAHL